MFLAYRPFIDPLSLHAWWWITIVPLALWISIAYKAMRVPDCEGWWSAYIKQVVWMTLQTVGGMMALAAVVFVIVELAVPLIN